MKTLTTQGKTIGIVEVPREAKEFEINYDGHYPQVLFISQDFSTVSLPHGQYELIGTLDNGMPDFVCEPYVRRMDDTYKNYDRPSINSVIFKHKTAIASFLSLLTKEGIEWQGKKLIVLKIK